MVYLSKTRISHWLSLDLNTNQPLDKPTQVQYLGTIKQNLFAYLRPQISSKEQIGLIVNLYANAKNPYLYYLTADYQISQIPTKTPKLAQGFMQPGTTNEAATGGVHNPPGGPPPPPAPRILNGTNFTEFEDSFLRVEANTLVENQLGNSQKAGQLLTAQR